jgi:hypothetical protein
VGGTEIIEGNERRKHKREHEGSERGEKEEKRRNVM